MLKALANVIVKYPQFNSSFDQTNSEIIVKHFINIGIAVATDRGLIVPVLNSPQKLDVLELANTLSELVATTKSGKIDLSRLQGGTFTVTNIGIIGGTMHDAYG